MAEFTEELKQEINIAEGGYSNHPNDKGGETKYGISKRQYPKLDIKNLTFPQAMDIYRRDYWNFYRLSQVDNQQIANKIFIALINMNPYSAVRCVQRAIVNCGIVIRVDGVMGSVTLGWVNRVHPGWFLDRLRVELCMHYAKEVADDKTQLVNLLGWINRGTS